MLALDRVEQDNDLFSMTRAVDGTILQGTLRRNWFGISSVCRLLLFSIIVVQVFAKFVVKLTSSSHRLHMALYCNFLSTLLTGSFLLWTIYKYILGFPAYWYVYEHLCRLWKNAFCEQGRDRVVLLLAELPDQMRWKRRAVVDWWRGFGNNCHFFFRRTCRSCVNSSSAASGGELVGISRLHDDNIRSQSIEAVELHQMERAENEVIIQSARESKRA